MVVFAVKMNMELTNKRVLKELLKKYNAKPEKYLGQHFILSKKALALMIEAAEIKADDNIIEIGPGLGALTQELAKTGANITAIEKDPIMIRILKETLADFKNINIIQADARQVSKSDFDTFGDKLGINYNRNQKYKIVANLPYNIATFLIRRWLESDPPDSEPPELMVLMIQKEVAQRIVAKPPRMNLLAVSIQFYAIAEIVEYVPKESFWPKPKVNTAIIKITPHKNKMSSLAGDRQKMKTFIAEKTFFAVVKAGFSQPRKQLIGSLSKKLEIPKEKILNILKMLEISEQTRAENLTLEQWLLLTNNLYPLLKREEKKF